MGFFLGNGVLAITLAPFGIYVNPNYEITEDTIRHETIHWKQQMEMFIIPFYLWYFIEYIIRVILFEDKPYMSLSMEKEAYANETNVNYLATRKHFTWLKYL